MTWKSILKIGLILFIAPYSFMAFAQTPITGKPVVITVEELIELQRLEDLKPAKPLRLRPEIKFDKIKSKNPLSSDAASSADFLKEPQSITATQAIHSNFLGTNLAETNAFPPDNNGAVGPTQVMIAVNGRVKVFPKTSVTAAATVTPTGNDNSPLASTFSVDADVFFNSVREAGGFTTDVHVRYDRLSGRWFILCIDVNPSSANNRLLIAVSSGSTITNSSSFTFFQIAHNLISPAGDAGSFFDYPTLGVDKFSLYIGANLFNSAGTSFLGCNMYVINKANLIAASPTLTGTAFRQSSATTDIYTPQGVDNDDPDATEGYFIGVSQTLYNRLVMKRVTYPGGVATFSSDIAINVSSTSNPRTVPYKGASPSTNILDGLDDRLYAAMVMKNKVTGTTSLWTSHSFNVTAAGAATSTPNRNGSRWYQISSLSSTPTVSQFGTVFDATTGAKNYWIPAIAASGQGHAAIITHSAGLSAYPNVEVAGRYRSDASGTMQTPLTATTATSNYNPGYDRWGDYAQVVVDPDDNMTLWGFAQYANGINTYGVRAVQLKAPAPPQTLVASLPSVGKCGTSIPLTITGTATSGSNQEFFDPGTGYSKRLVVSISSPSSITVNSTTFNSISQVTALINTSTKTAGTFTVTVTNPDGQTATGTFNTIDCNCTNGTFVPSVAIAVTSGTNPTCSGTGVTFTATPTNGGTNPTYQWKKNGANVGTGLTYSDAGTSSGSIVCVMTVGVDLCTTTSSTTSSGINLSVTPIVTPSVSIGLTSGVNPTCSGSSVIFTATPTNGGTNPSYQWKKDGANVGTGVTYTDAGTTGGVITCVMTSGSGVCLSTPTATSAGTTLTINPLLTPSVGIGLTTGTNPTCSGSSVTFTATPTNGGTNPSFQWKKDGADVGTGVTYTDAGITGGEITCVMTPGSGVCPSTPTATSAGSTLSVISITAPTSVLVDKVAVCAGSNVNLSASCTSGTVTWYNQDTGGTAIGTGNNLVQSPTSNTIYYASCENGSCISTRSATVLVSVGTPSATLSLTTNLTSGSTFQIANQNITAINKIISPAEAIYRAGNYVLLNSGFEAQTGSKFKAEIGGCN